MRKLLTVVLNSLCSWFFVADLAIADTQFDLNVEVCQNYRSGQFLDCEKVEKLTVGSGFVRLQVVLQIDWLVAEGQRSEREIYLRWEFKPTDSDAVLLSNHRSNEDYVWLPRNYNDPTRWVVTQRAWPDTPGTYSFFVYENPAEPSQFLKRVNIEVVDLGT